MAIYKRDNYATYPYDYFSGIQSKVFFGDIWVDDIVTINYNLTQNKLPIYGYASQYFNAIAKGQVIVQGSLMISFKEVGYLNLIQAALDKQKENKLDLNKFKNVNIGNNKFNPELVDFVGTTYSPNGSPQIIRKQQTIENVLNSKIVSNKLNTSFNSDDGKFRDFEDFAEILEDTIWGDANGKPFDVGQLRIKRADEFDYNVNGGITIANNDSYANVLNILIAFGDIDDYRAEHTLVVLNDVHFQSQGMVISPNGDPIGENYTFFARTLNRSITSATFNINPTKFEVNGDKISKSDDIDNIQKYLAENNYKSYNLIIKSGLSNNTWTPLNFPPVTIKPSYNKTDPYIDQLIRTVEEVVNSSSSFSSSLLDYSQIVVSIDNINMILEQQIPDTYTFHVISPTRSGFRSVAVVTRDNLWDGIATSSDEVPIVEVNKNPKRQIKIAKEIDPDALPTSTTSTNFTVDENEENLLNDLWNEPWTEVQEAKANETIRTTKTGINPGSANAELPNSVKYAPKDLDALVVKYSKQAGIDPNLIRGIIAQESSWNPNASSGAGAVGLMQLMTKTAKDLGLSAEDRSNPEKNIAAGVKYIKWLKKQLGSEDLALAAYNGGIGHLKYHNKDISKMNPETVDYVDRVEAYKKLYTSKYSSTDQSQYASSSSK